jgi:hypothetical protein
MGKGQDFLSGFLGSLGDSANMMTQVGMMKQMFPQSGEENIAKLKATCDATEGVQWNPVTNQCEASGVGRRQPTQQGPGDKQYQLDYGPDLGMTGMGGSNVRRPGGK